MMACIGPDNDEKTDKRSIWRNKKRKYRISAKLKKYEINRVKHGRIIAQEILCKSVEREMAIRNKTTYPPPPRVPSFRIQLYEETPTESRGPAAACCIPSIPTPDECKLLSNWLSLNSRPRTHDHGQLETNTSIREPLAYCKTNKKFK